MREDSLRWNQRYAAGEPTVTIVAEPELESTDTVIVAANNYKAHGIKPLALDVASGKGGGALYLASIGYRTIAIDCSSEGLKICAAAARSLQLEVFPVVSDLDRTSLPSGIFQLISVVRYLNRPFFPALVNALAPGGMLFYKTFNIRHLEKSPRFNPDFLLQNGELDLAFADLEKLAGNEEGTTSFIVAQKPLNSPLS